MESRRKPCKGGFTEYSWGTSGGKEIENLWGAQSWERLCQNYVVLCFVLWQLLSLLLLSALFFPSSVSSDSVAGEEGKSTTWKMTFSPTCVLITDSPVKRNCPFLRPFFFFFFSLPVFVAAPESCHALASLILIPWQFICQSLPLDLQYDCFHPSLLFCPSIIDYKSPGNVELCFFFLKQNLKEFIVLYYLRMYFCHFCFFLLLCEWPHNRNKNLTDEEKWNNQASNCHQIM